MSSFLRHTKGGQALLVYLERLSKYSDYIWSGFETWFNSLLMLGATIVISRNIGASEVGAFAVIQLIVVFFQIITTLGITDSIIRDEDVSGRYLPTIFWVGVGLSVCAVISIFALGPFFLRLISGGQYLFPLYILSFSMIFNAWSSVLLGVLQRSMKFKAIAKARVSSMLISVAVGLLVSISGGGIWSFVALTITNYFCMTCIFSLSSRWVPRFVFSALNARSMLGFNFTVMGSNLLSFLSRRGDYLVVGRMVGTDALGYYSICGRMAFVLLDGLVGVVMRVAYPKVAQCIRSGDQPREYWVSLHVMLLLLVAPVFTFIGCYSTQILNVCFDSTWSKYGYVLSILSIVSFLSAMRYVNAMLCRAYGRPIYFLRLNFIYVLLGLIIVFVSAKNGLFAVCLAWLLLSILITPITFLILKIFFNISFQKSDTCYLKGISVSLISITVLLLILSSQNIFAVSDLLELITGGVISVLYYVYVFNSKAFRMASSLFINL